MSAFCTWLQFKYNKETRRFYKILQKDTGLFRHNKRTFRTFQNFDSQTQGSGLNSNTKPNTAIKNSKNQFQKCPKNYSPKNHTLIKKEKCIELNKNACEGCSLCSHVCPQGAITMKIIFEPTSD